MKLDKNNCRCATGCYTNLLKYKLLLKYLKKNRYLLIVGKSKIKRKLN